MDPRDSGREPLPEEAGLWEVLLGGTIGVESDLGRGTCFTVRLPAQATAAPA